eukprot:10979579-Ditylum_brightwellii.AAC.1
MLSQQDKRVHALQILKENTDAKACVVSDEEAISKEFLVEAGYALSKRRADLDAADSHVTISRRERKKHDSELADADAAVAAKLRELNTIIS